MSRRAAWWNGAWGLALVAQPAQPQPPALVAPPAPASPRIDRHRGMTGLKRLMCGRKPLCCGTIRPIKHLCCAVKEARVGDRGTGRAEVIGGVDRGNIDPGSVKAARERRGVGCAAVSGALGIGRRRVGSTRTDLSTRMLRGVGIAKLPTTPCEEADKRHTKRRGKAGSSRTEQVGHSVSLASNIASIPRKCVIGRGSQSEGRLTSTRCI
jgi:hypothetical protein